MYRSKPPHGRPQCAQQRPALQILGLFSYSAHMGPGRGQNNNHLKHSKTRALHIHATDPLISDGATPARHRLAIQTIRDLNAQRINQNSSPTLIDQG
eukprot:gene16-biopygen2